MAGSERVELSSAVLETAVLPLHQDPMCEMPLHPASHKESNDTRPRATKTLESLMKLYGLYLCVDIAVYGIK